MSISRAVRAIALDVRPLRESRDYRLLASGQLVSVFGRQITAVAIPLQVYLLTGSTFAVGLLAAIRLVPLVVTSIAGGILADRIDRRLILLISQLPRMGCSAGLALLATQHRPAVWLIFSIAVLVTVFGAIEQPARSATIPNVVRRETLPAAMALNLGVGHLTSVTGPAAGGLVIAGFGLPAAYGIDAATYVVSIAAILFMSAQPPKRVVTESPIQSLRTGFAFIKQNRVILGSFAYDLDAMIFGLPRALFPVLALHLYHGGATALGLLYAAPSAGAVIVILTSGWLRHVRHLGRVFMIAEILWGASIAIAGLLPVLWPVLILLAVAGGADAAGVAGSTSIMQLEAPEELRGRVTAAYFVVMGGGPYIGDFETGTVAALFSPEVSFVAGGTICAALGLVFIPLFSGLWRYRAQRTFPATGAGEVVTG